MKPVRLKDIRSFAVVAGALTAFGGFAAAGMLYIESLRAEAYQQRENTRLQKTFTENAEKKCTAPGVFPATDLTLLAARAFPKEEIPDDLAICRTDNHDHLYSRYDHALNTITIGGQSANCTDYDADHVLGWGETSKMRNEMNRKFGRVREEYRAYLLDAQGTPTFTDVAFIAPINTPRQNGYSGSRSNIKTQKGNT